MVSADIPHIYVAMTYLIIEALLIGLVVLAMLTCFVSLAVVRFIECEKANITVEG